MNFKTFLKFSKIHSNSAHKKSTYDFIHNKKRNRLTEDRARDLVYVHLNLRLLENIQNSKLWTMLKQLLNGNNGLLLIRTPNNTDLSLTCHCWLLSVSVTDSF